MSRALLFTIVVVGLAGCGGGGLKEGSPPANTGYVAPPEVNADGTPVKGAPAK